MVILLKSINQRAVLKRREIIDLSVGTEGVQESEIDKQISDLKQKQVIFDKYEKSLNEKELHGFTR
jgi:hypothetical protein